MKLAVRLFILLLTFALIPVLLTSVWFLRNRERARAAARTLHVQVAATAAALVEGEVGEMNRALGFVSDLERAAPGAELRVLQGAALARPALLLVSLLDAQGRETLRVADPTLFPPQEGRERGGSEMVAAALSGGRLAAGDPVRVGERVAVPLVHPLSRGGAAYAVYDFSSVLRRLSAVGVGDGGRILLLSPQGRPWPGFADMLPASWDGAALGVQPSGWLEFPGRAGEKMVGAYAAVGGTGWRALTSQPAARAYAEDDALRTKAGGFLLLIVIAVAGASLWAAGTLAEPLSALTVGAKRVAGGRFNEPVPEAGWAEARELARVFNSMMLRLDEYQRRHVDGQLDEKARTDALVQTIPDGILLVSLKGEILYMNPMAERVLGVAGSSPTGRSLDEVFVMPAAQEFVLSLMAAAQTGIGRDITVDTPEGGRLGLFSCRSALVLREKIPIGVVILLRDVTYERELEKMKQNIMETVTHDLRSPLTSIMGYVQLILMGRSGPLTESQRNKLEVVLTSSQHLGELINDILDVSKFESGLMKLNLQRGALETILKNAHALLSVQAEKYGVRLSFEVAPGLPEFDFDAIQVQRVVTNLVTNALKFTPKDGTVAVTVRRLAAGSVHVAVRDSGVGIPKDRIGQLFQKFFQVEETKKDARARGTGLGLTICKSVVESHGGRIWVESEWQKGSVFQFTLPVGS